MPSNSLEQEAMDRVRRMYSSFDNRPPQRRPQSHATRPQNPQNPPQSVPAPAPEPEKPEESKTAPEPRRDNRGVLDILMQDKEQSLIMLLLVILMKDGADMNLVIALIYMLI